MGKYINLIRRKLTDRTLAKRMKRLVKQWQNLVPARTPNGLASAASSNPSPSSPPTPVPTPRPPVQHTNPTMNRFKIKQMLSKVKKSSQGIVPPAQQTGSPANNHFHSSSEGPSTVKQNTPSPPSQSSLNRSCSPSLTLSFPINSQPPRPPLPEKVDSLLVRIPRHFERHSRTDTVADSSSSRLNAQLPHLPQKNLSGSQTGFEEPLRLLVSIETSVLAKVAENSRRLLPVDTEQRLIGEVQSSETSSGMETRSFETSPESFPELAESRLGPEESIPGVHGCIGHDGLWYSWADPIPGDDSSVTVLPYVYIDGWETIDRL